MRKRIFNLLPDQSALVSTRINKQLKTVVAAALGVTILALAPQSYADNAAPVTAPQAEETWAVHGQVTTILQGHPRFTSPYRGPQSMDPNGRQEKTTDITLFAGTKLWRNAELWINAEIDQGFGLSHSFGAAGFPSGGAYKEGANMPYLRMPRLFVRQVFPFGGEQVVVEAGANQLASVQSTDNLTLTVGKMAVVDIFDNNTYAHDPRSDFLNWAMIDGGALDYAADMWGYTYGAAAEWNQGNWTWRNGIYQMSPVPNGKITGIDFHQFEFITEVEERHQLAGHPGKLKLLAYLNHASMSKYSDAVQSAIANNTTPDVAANRHSASNYGFVLNGEQELMSDIGAFVRLSKTPGDKEVYEFTDISQGFSAGIQIKGDRWGRHDDTIGLATARNSISGDAQRYFKAGGLGVLIGDGTLNYGAEKILETYYAIRVHPHATITVDYQRIKNPGYNLDRGPVTVYGLRLHADI
ncbi:carbohydrate porin [Undibacterium sp. Ji67W]|uniref:carbohydrate porin n=1 Tax=Undibacterium sp. Ji67W TaxID=3413042 RepID=UPI003BF2B67A